MDYLYDAALTDLGDNITPSTEIRRHLAALRLREGQTVTLMNGKGLRASCTLQGSIPDGTLHIESREHVAAPLPLTLAMGLVDSRDRLEFAVEKASELGVTEIVLLASDHAAHQRATLVRLQAKIIAACEQSGNAWLPTLLGPMSVDDFLSSTTVTTIIVGDQDGSNPLSVVGEQLAVLVGPEGGFSVRESALFEHDARIVRWAIGALRLRAETAAVSMLATVKVVRC